MVSNAGARSVCMWCPLGQTGHIRLPAPASCLPCPTRQGVQGGWERSAAPLTRFLSPQGEGNTPLKASFLHECQMSQRGQLPRHGR